VYRALRRIRRGEEITINYAGSAGRRFDLGFEVV
jgi:hypothetical protein